MVFPYGAAEDRNGKEHAGTSTGLSHVALHSE
jgi:hypothetical protein